MSRGTDLARPKDALRIREGAVGQGSAAIAQISCDAPTLTLALSARIVFTKTFEIGRPSLVKS
jgi:hypothetical protein